MTSASLQSCSRNRRIMAQTAMAAEEAFDATREPCKRDEAMIVTRTVTGVAYHFRTPSPGGQVSCPYVDLPVSPPFKLTWRLLAQERDAANHDLYCTRKPPCVSRSSQNEKRGKFPCRLNHRFLFWHVAADWPRAAIRSDNRPLLAVLLVPGQLLSSAEVSQPVSLSGPRATWFIARHTHRAANRSRSNNRKQRDGAALEVGCGVFCRGLRLGSSTARHQRPLRDDTAAARLRPTHPQSIGTLVHGKSKSPPISVGNDQFQYKGTGHV